MKFYWKVCTILFILPAISFIPVYAGVTRQSTESFTFVQLCDTQLGFGESYEKDVNSFRLAVQRINDLKPDFVVICGDMVNTFDEKSLKDFNDIKTTLKVPCYCCPGNHDIGNEPNAISLDRYRKVFGRDYFSFEHKGYTFVITNTCLWKVTLEGESQKHDLWCKQTIEAARDKKSPVFVIGHHPLYVSSPDEPDAYNPIPLVKRKELLDLFERCGVIAVLTGHTHQRVINSYKDIKLVTGETTSRNLDRHPLAFILWEVSSPDSKIVYYPIELQS
jgi:serine/threonine-protein phosphatase CPPED1